MEPSVLQSTVSTVCTITLNRPDVLNAWNAPMRELLLDILHQVDTDDDIRAIVLTGAGDRAFGAGQDLSESKTFDADRAEEWMAEWQRLYDTIRALSKPLVIALNGLAAGSAFQVALLGDVRVGHPDVRMGQPEINSGIPSVTGPWIMREMLGLSRTVELTLTGRMMDAEECRSIGLIHRLVPRDQVQEEAFSLAKELAAKPPIAMALTKKRFREVTQEGFLETMAAGVRIQREAYGSGEPARMMEAFLAERAKRRVRGSA